jgi:hypothetical protein
MYRLERIVEPVAEPVSVAEGKDHLRVKASVTEDDFYIASLLKAGREWVEDYTGRALMDQTWRLTIDDNPWVGDTVGGFKSPFNVPQVLGLYTGAWRYGRHGAIYLRKSPVIAVNSFVVVDAEGNETPVEDLGSPTLSSYALREEKSKWPRLVPLSGVTFSSGIKKIEFRAGFATGLGSPLADPDPAEVPELIKVAIKLWAEAIYDRDEKMMPLLLDTAKRIVQSEVCELRMA